MEMGTQQTEWNRFKLELGRICPPSPFPPMSPQRRHLTSLWMSCLLHRGWLSRPRPKRLCNFHLAASQVSALGEAGCPVVRTVSGCGESDRPFRLASTAPSARCKFLTTARLGIHLDGKPDSHLPTKQLQVAQPQLVFYKLGMPR
ncbi:uncharacterized protein LOC104876450 isoform X2 [Fukomys damarensis]|uniref:uncharacterized protein LOC104876450 isoform X2 n=1 Tax=Fukomys damarensis TaxID=885580 RepID=UPI0008FF53EC|nr:uncharacterized protein LOC104876450 isoform X2 [Fukomys damarensis]